MTSKKEQPLQEQKKWKEAFASLFDIEANPQMAEWKKAFEEVISIYNSNENTQLEIDVWTTAFRNVIDSWNVNPANILTTVLQQNPNVQPVTMLSQKPLAKIRAGISSTTIKKDWSHIKDIFENKGIYCFYHFTEISNLDSIRQHGGLYSWYSCEQNGIKIPHPGGSPESRMLDCLYNLQDYVRLSFCDDHPMAYRHKQDGADLVLLKISTDVAFQQDTLFSDINATATGHSVGGSLDDLNKINFDAVKKHFVSRNDPDFSAHQAECLVKTFIPLKYILNINNPEKM